LESIKSEAAISSKNEVVLLRNPVGQAKGPSMEEIDKVYSKRFSARDQRKKDELWRVLCEVFLQRFIREEDNVLDLGAGYCEFINHIHCASKCAVDLNPDTKRYADPEVTVYEAESTDIPMVTSESQDVVFCSNFFEHLPSKDALLQTLGEIHRILRFGGKLIVIQPNIKYAFREYWDFLDHHLPLSHLSLEEALVNSGFRVEVLLPRFMPYTTKSRLPQAGWLLRVYLALPPLWRLFGKQMFILACKAPECSIGGCSL
jgi:SAM-dependent methyltransferase